jgi:hypothetical protein
MEELGLPAKRGFGPRLAASCRPTVAIWCHRPFYGAAASKDWVKHEAQLTFHPGLGQDFSFSMTAIWLSPPRALPDSQGLAQARSRGLG